jgi:hypothetical protein
MRGLVTTVGPEVDRLSVPSTAHGTASACPSSVRVARRREAPPRTPSREPPFAWSRNC